MKLAGTVTFYRCDVEHFLENINSYIEELDILYVLDNNEQGNQDVSIFSKYPKIKYVKFGENRGISAALNYVLQKVQIDGYDFLLTMDQDSSFLPNTMHLYKKLVQSYENTHPSSVAVYSVNYNYNSALNIHQDISRQIHVAITSGSIIPVNLSIKLGGFDEKLFIDEVDTEFCYRAERAGYKIIEFPGITMKHAFGNRTYHSFLGYKFNTLNHNAIRKYYITRNKIYVMKKYPSVRGRYIIELIKMIVKVLLVETNKLNKLYYIWNGIIDAKAKRMGSYKKRNN